MIHHGCSIKVFRGTPVSWLITSGYYRVFFRMSDIKSLWLTDPLGQDGRSGGCMALWTVSSSSSLMSWVALTASPGHGMYTRVSSIIIIIADGGIHSWTQPAAVSSAYSNFAENRKWTKRKAQQRQYIFTLFEYQRGAYNHKTSYMYTLLVRWYSAFTKVQGGGGGTKKIWSMHLLLLSTAC